MLNILLAIVSSLGEAGVKVIHPAEYEDGDNDKSNGGMALLGHHEAGLHYHSLEPIDLSARLYEPGWPG